MKPNDIHRSVKNLNQDRKMGDAPHIGRVPRMPGVGRRGAKRRRSNPSRGDFGRRAHRKRNILVLSWSIVFALTAIGVICSAVFLWMKHGRHKAGDPSKTAQPTIRSEVRVASRFPSPSEEEALALVKQAVQARDPESVEKCFRMDGTSPEAAVMFLEGMSRRDGPITGFKWIGSTDKNGLLIDTVLVRARSGETIARRIAHLLPDDHGVWKTDFHAFARTCVPAWSEITKETTKQARIRVFFQRDTYYNGRFGDESSWVCHELWSPDGAERLLGYCRKDSPQHAALDRILRRAAATDANILSAQAYLEIRRVEGSEARQFEITRVLAEGWVKSETAFDGQ